MCPSLITTGVPATVERKSWTVIHSLAASPPGKFGVTDKGDLGCRSM